MLAKIMWWACVGLVVCLPTISCSREARARLFPRSESTSQGDSSQAASSPVARDDCGDNCGDDWQLVDLKNDEKQKPPAGAEREFSTDFSRTTILYSEILSGGPPKDGIPSIDSPRTVTISQADEWLGATETVLVVPPLEKTGGVARIYPIQILMWHEIVNDRIGALPLSVTYCPLCNSGLAFERTLDEVTLDFGTTGRLRRSNMVMYDRQTESWWQQATGEAIAGTLTGKKLVLLPLLQLPWNLAKKRYPRADVLSRETGHRRAYGINPYVGYDKSVRPFLYRGPAIDPEFRALERVVAVIHRGEQVAYAYPRIQQELVLSEIIGGDAVVVFWQPGTASPLDAETAAGGWDVGSANAFLATISTEDEGTNTEKRLTFRAKETKIYDMETGSVWDESGVAISGALRGTSLTPIPAVQHFWFSWTAFNPNVE